MGTFNNAWNTIRGKVSARTFWSRSLSKSLWGSDLSVDYTRNDYDLYRSLYFGASVNNKAKDMLVGAMFAKPIVNAAAGFAIGNGFTISLDEKYAKAEQAVNEWLKDNHSHILDAVIHEMRDGDSYLYIDEFGFLSEFDAKDVDIMLDPVTGEVVGFDVNEVYEETDPQNGNKQKWNLLRQYRTDSIRYLKYKDNQRENPEELYNRVYTVDGSIQPNENQEFLAENILPRPLPVIHFANNREPRMVYGNSELLNCLIGIKNYTAVAANATKGVIYNSSPVPFISGVSDSDKVARKSQTKGDKWDNFDNEDDKTNWGPDTVLYFTDKDAKAGFLQANGFMDDVGKLLEYYFYLIVQASETPEFIFGTAIQGSRASVETQMPIVTQKADRKRAQLYEPLKQLIEAYIDRQIRLSNVDFLPLKNQTLDVTIEFPDLVDEDKTLTLEVVKAMLEEGILSEETALTLTLGDKIPDVKKELANAHKQAEANIKRNQAVFEQGSRIQDEVDNANGGNGNEPTPSNTEEE